MGADPRVAIPNIETLHSERRHRWISIVGRAIVAARWEVVGRSQGMPERFPGLYPPPVTLLATAQHRKQASSGGREEEQEEGAFSQRDRTRRDIVARKHQRRYCELRACMADIPPLSVPVRTRSEKTKARASGPTSMISTCDLSKAGRTGDCDV